MKKLIPIALGICVLFNLSQADEKRVPAINPINLDYKIMPGNPCQRHAADAEIVMYKDRYYLFASKADGYWSSEDLVNWKHIPTADLPLENWAPTACVINGELYFFVSAQPDIFKAVDVDKGKWEKVDSKHGLNITDPALFQDDDGRVYLYWGCANAAPIMGVEVDPNDGFRQIGEQKELIRHDIKTKGWERPGDNNDQEKNGWNEAPQMVKHGGKYFLQYASPGTEYVSYCDSAYVSESPLGPFTLQDDGMFSYKPGGFIGGAGHGNTFKDRYGNYWHVTTQVIAVRDYLERRIGLFPVFFTDDGRIYAQTEFTDRPFFVPQEKFDFAAKAPTLGMNILSYGKTAKASSSEPDFPPSNAVDENVKTWWSAKTGNKGERFEIDLGKPMNLKAAHVNFADHGMRGRAENPIPPIYKYKIEVSSDGKNWKTAADMSGNESDEPHKLVMFDRGIKARYAAIENMSDLDGKFSLYDFRLFGNGGGKKPEAPELTATRNLDDRRTAKLSWEPVKGAQGYVIRYGTAKNRLFLERTIRDTSVTLNTLNTDAPYYFAVTPFNENGFGKESNIVRQE